MPLIKSATKAAFEENIRREIEAGRPRDQAVAIAYSVRREAQHRHNSTERNYVDGMHAALSNLIDDIHPVRRHEK